MKKKKIRRVIALVLSLLLVMELFPTSVFATEVEKTDEEKVEIVNGESEESNGLDEVETIENDENKIDLEELNQEIEPNEKIKNNETESSEETKENDEVTKENSMEETEPKTSEDLEIEEKENTEIETQSQKLESLESEQNISTLSVASDATKYNSYEQFLAYYYLNYSTLSYYLNVSELPYHTYLKNSDEKFRSRLRAWKIATLDAGSLVENSTKEIEFYEFLVFDILYQDTAEDSVLKNAETGINATQASLIKEIADAKWDFTLSTNITKDNADEILRKLTTLDNLKFLGDQIGILEKGIQYTKTVEELIRKLAMISKLKECSNEVEIILRDICNYSQDSEMKEGCRKVALIATGLMKEEEIMAILSGEVVSNEITKYGLGKIWDGILQSTSLGKGISIGQKIGKLSSNILFGTDEVVENWYSMEQVYEFEKVLKGRVVAYKNNFEKNPTYNNAALFNKASNMYLGTLSVGMKYAIEYASAVEGKGILGWIYKNFTNKDDYNKLMSQLEFLKECIDQVIEYVNNNTYNLYLQEMQTNGLTKIEWEKTDCNVNQEDINGNMDEVSEDLFQLTDQHVSEGYTCLTSKMTYSDYYLENGTLNLSGQTLTVYGDFYLKSGTIDVQEGTLDIRGNLRVTGGRIYVNGGKIIVGGNAYFAKEEDAGKYEEANVTVAMDNDKDTFIIEGSLITYFHRNINGFSECSTGVMKIGENWKNYSSNSTSGKGKFKIVFTGTKNTILNGGNGVYAPCIQIENASKRTMAMQGIIKTEKLEGGDININAELNPNLSLGETTGKLNIEGNVRLDINKKVVDNIVVNGDCTVGEMMLNGKELKVNGDLYKTDGRLYLKGGKVGVEGNAYFANKSSDNQYGSITGTLEMSNEEDIFTIKGNLVTYFYYSGSGNFNCSSGVMNIGGSWQNYKEFAGKESFKAVFTGTKNVLINGKAKITVPELQVENVAQRKITMQGSIETQKIEGGDLNIVAKSNPNLSLGETTGKLNIEGNVQLDVNKKASDNIVVNGDCTIGEMMLNGKELKVNGDLYKAYNGRLYLKGGKIGVEGDTYFATKSADNQYGSITGTLEMSNEEDIFTIKGNLITYFQGSGYFNCSAGIMNIEGSWTNYDWWNGGSISGTGSFKVVLSGTKDAIINGKTRITVPELEIENASKRKITMQGNIEAKKLEGGDLNIVAKSNPSLSLGETTGKLNVEGNVQLDIDKKVVDNIVVNGDCTVGEMMLNGKELKVNGDFYKAGGRLYLKGGKVGVEGDAYFATKYADNQYGSISGILEMSNEEDRFNLKGNLITCFDYSRYFNCSAGIMNIEGNWTNYNCSISGTGSFKVVLSGTKDAMMNGKARITVPELEVENASQRKITMQGEISANTFRGEDANIIAKDVPGLTFNKTTGKVNIDGNVRMQVSTEAGGDIKVSGDLYNNGLAVGANTLSVGNNLYISSDNTLAIGPSGKLNVTGDVWFNRGILSLAGTTKIQGNLYQANGELKLNGGEVEIDNDYRIQTVDVSSGERIWNESYGTLSMIKAKEKLTVNGDFYVQSRNSSTLNAGLMTLKGNFYQLSKEGGYTRNFLPTGTHTVMLAGTKPQKVSFESTESKFNILQVTQNLTQYTFNPNPCWNKLEEKEITPEVTKVAEGSCGDNLTWVLTSDGTMTFSGKEAMRDYSSAKLVPWYQYREQVVSIELGKEITSIGNFAFYGLPNLKKVSIPEGVNSIGGFSFKGCTALTDVKLPSTLTKLGESAFYGCSSLSQINIPEGVYTVWAYTFKNCTNLAKVTLPSTLIKLDEAAFYGCASLEQLKIPDNVSIIGIYCFKNCSKLSELSLPVSLTNVREAAFYGTALTNVTIPSKVQTIGAYAFKNCTVLKKVQLPNKLQKIDDSAFYGCTKMETLELPDSVTSISNYAFRKCSGLQTIKFSNQLKTIGESAFYGCSGLTELNLPDTISRIEGYAFKGCTKVNKVHLPLSINTLTESVLYGCTGIASIEIPKNVKVIENYAFSSCSGLKEITFTGTMPEIGAYAFARVNAQVSYPIGDATWSKDKLQNYGGQLNWIIPQEEESEDASAIVSVEPEIKQPDAEESEKTENKKEEVLPEEKTENSKEEKNSESEITEEKPEEKASEISDNVNEKEEKTEEQQEKTKTEEIKENTLEEQQKEITNSKE